VLDKVPPQFESNTGEWVGLSGRARTLVYNTEMIDDADLPASVLDLTDPRYEGMLGVAPTNGSFQDFVTAMRQATGDDATLAFLTGLRENGAEIYPDNNSIVQAVARGEVALGLVNHYYNVRAKAEDPSLPTENHFFADGDLGNMILVTGVAKVRDTEQSSDADRLVDFLLSPEAQTYFSEETKEYPLAAGVAPAPELPPLESIPAPTEDFSSLGDDLEGTTRLIRDSGLTS
jgi:iron(III) transport system substrate-binding protein